MSCRSGKRPAYRYAANTLDLCASRASGPRHRTVFDAVELIDARAAAGFHQMIGYIDADNMASLGLYERFGLTGRPAARHRFPIWPLGRQRDGAALARRRFNGSADTTPRTMKL